MSWKAPTVLEGKSIRALAPEEHWRRAVEEILTLEGLAQEAPTAVASGSDVVWGCGSSVVKLSTPKWSEQIAWEVHVLQHVSGRLPVDTPKVLATGSIDGWPYLVMSRVAGQAIGDVWPGCSREERSKLAGEMGAACRALHDLDLPDSLHAGQPAWQDFWAECQGRTDQLAGGKASGHLAKECTAFLARVGE